MPTYEYICRSCGKNFDQSRKLNKPPSPCACGSVDLAQVYHPPTIFVKGEPTTLGQLSEKNTNNMGKYELQDKRKEQSEGKKKKEAPWYTESGAASASEINKMTPQQKASYIKKGKK
ncbi:hypothetical protein CL634_05510 [bacterium]|nr:hypothetical protein [bacterium]